MSKDNVNSFISDLESKIILDEEKLKEMENKKQNISGLIDYIKNLQILLNNEKEDNNSIIRCDIGDGIYLNGKLDKNNKKILINIGKDVYVELTFVEAIDNLLTQQRLIEKRIILIKNELIKNKSYKKLAKGINETLVKHQLLEGNYIQKEKKDDGENFMI